MEESLFSAIASQNRWGASSTQAKQRGFPLEEKESALVEAINVPSFFPSSFLSFAGLSTSPVMQSQVLVASRVQLPLTFLRTPISFISRQRGGEKKKKKKTVVALSFLSFSCVQQDLRKDNKEIPNDVCVGKRRKRKREGPLSARPDAHSDPSAWVGPCFVVHEAQGKQEETNSSNNNKKKKKTVRVKKKKAIKSTLMETTQV